MTSQNRPAIAPQGFLLLPATTQQLQLAASPASTPRAPQSFSTLRYPYLAGSTLAIPLTLAPTAPPISLPWRITLAPRRPTATTSPRRLPSGSAPTGNNSHSSSLLILAANFVVAQTCSIPGRTRRTATRSSSHAAPATITPTPIHRASTATR